MTPIKFWPHSVICGHFQTCYVLCHFGKLEGTLYQIIIHTVPFTIFAEKRVGRNSYLIIEAISIGFESDFHS